MSEVGQKLLHHRRDGLSKEEVSRFTRLGVCDLLIAIAARMLVAPGRQSLSERVHKFCVIGIEAVIDH